MKQKTFLFSIFTVLLTIATFTSVFAQATEVKLSFSQGDEKEIVLENILGFYSINTEISGADFLSIEDGMLLVNVPLLQKAGPYFGIILADGKEIPLVVDISDKDSPFEIEVTLQNGEIAMGKDINFFLDIKVVKPIGRASVSISYEVKDLQGNSILKEQKEKTIEFSEIVIDNIGIPSFVEPGKHVLITKVDYQGKLAVTSEFFEVKENKVVIPTSFSSTNKLFFILIIIAIIALLFTLLYFKRSLDLIIKQHPRKLTQIYAEFTKTKEASAALEKINRLSELLDRAYKIGAIDKKNFAKLRSRITRLVGKVETRFARGKKPKGKIGIKDLRRELILIDKAYRLGSIKKSRYERAKKRILRALAEYEF